MKNKIALLSFLFILIVGLFLRFYQLGTIPGSLEWDEVSIGYNAFSIVHTAKDEYGVFLPTAFRAFGEYKQPVYIYLDTIPINLFGLNAFAVRFPSALFGSLTIVFVYFLTKELFAKQKFSEKIALLAMFFFAVSPWSIQFSRAAFEANVSLSFVIAGIWLFLRGVRLKKDWCLYLSVLLLVLSTYTYISAKLIVPLLFVSLLVFAKTYLIKRKKFVVILIIIFAIVSSLWVLDTRSVSRGGGVIFTNQKAELLEVPIKEMQFDITNNDKIGTLLHNRRVVYLQILTSNYLSHFNPLWLFITGDSVNRHHAPGFGLLYIMSLPFILLGIYFLSSRFFSSSWILFVWFILAPIASTLTFEAPHALRSLLFLPTWQIFESAGYIFVLQKITKTIYKKVILVIACLFFVCNFAYYIHQYFVHTNTEFQKDWQYGYKEAVQKASSVPQNKRVIFSSSFEQPYIFYLFYTAYDPQKYISQGSSWRTQKKCYTIYTAYFGDCQEKLRNGDIYISTDGLTLPNGRQLEVIHYANGNPAITVSEYK